MLPPGWFLRRGLRRPPARHPPQRQDQKAAKDRRGTSDRRLPHRAQVSNPRQQEAHGEPRQPARQGGANAPDGAGREQPRLAQPLEDVSKTYPDRPETEVARDLLAIIKKQKK